MADTEQDERRWQEAFAVLADARSAASRSALSPAQRRAWALVVVLLLIALGAGTAVAVFLVSSRSDPSEPSGARVAVGFSLVLVGVAVIVVDLVRRARRGSYAETARAPALVLSRAQRRTLLRQVRGLEAVSPRLLPLARDVAARQLRTVQVLFTVGLVTEVAGQALMSPLLLNTVIFVLLLALAAVTVPWSLWNARRASRFLQEHPSD